MKSALYNKLIEMKKKMKDLESKKNNEVRL